MADPTRGVSSPSQVVRIDPAGAREAYEAAGRHLLDLVRALPADVLDEPALGTWSMRTLVGHASRSFTTVTDYLHTGAGRPIELGHFLDYARVFGLVTTDPSAIDERAYQAGRDLGDDITTAVAARLDAAISAVASHPDDAPVATPAGVMRLTDYLPSRIFELVTHGEDIKHAARDRQAAGPEVPARSDVASTFGVPAPRDAMAIALTFAAGLAAERTDAADVLAALTGRAPIPPGFSVL